MWWVLKKHGRAALSVIFILLFIMTAVGYYTFSPTSFSDDNLSTCNGTLVYACPDGFTYDNASGVCIGDVSCPGGGTYNQPLGACTYCPSGTYDPDLNTCTGASPSSTYTGSYNLVSYNGGFICEGSPICPDNSSMYYDSETSSMKCESQPTVICKTQNTDIFNGFCSKRCYDARTDVPKRIKLYSTDGTQSFSFTIRKGFSGWGEIRPYEDGCFIQGQYWQLCVEGDNLVETFVHPVSGKTYTVSAPIQKKYWNTFSWSVNPNLVALFTRQHSTGKTTFKYADLIYQPIDNDTVSGSGVTFSETFAPLTGDPYDFEYIEIQPGSLFSAPAPFCSEQIAQCLYNVADVHAWTEHGRVFFGINTGLNSGASDEVVYGVSTYFRSSQEVAYNTGDLFMSSAADPSKGGAFRMWYSYTGGAGSAPQTVPPQQGCPSGYTLNGGICTAQQTCQTGTYDSTAGECVSEASPSCPDSYTYSSSAGRCTAPALCPGNGTLNYDTDQCQTYLGQSCPSGYNLQNGQCVGAPTCPEGTQLQNGRCVMAAETECPTGYTYDSNLDKCVSSPICPDNTTLDTSTDECVGSQQCTTTGGTCSALHGTATKIYYTSSDMSKFKSWEFEGWFGFERAGDNKIKFCINSYCGYTTIPLYSESYPVWSDWGKVVTNQYDQMCPSGTLDEKVQVRYVYVQNCGPAVQSYRACLDYNDNTLGTVYGSLSCGSNYVDNVMTGKYRYGGQYESIEWMEYKVNDSGITNYKLCLRPASPAGSSGYIYPQSEGSDSCIWAWVPYKCSQTGTVFKTQSECQSNCKQTTCSCPSGTTQSGDQCTAAPTCPAGGSYDTTVHKCVVSINHCPDGYTYDSSSNTCYKQPTCQYGTYDSGSGQCVVTPSSSCSDGYTQSGNICVANPQCPSGGNYDSTLKECAADMTNSGCPDDSTYENGKCYSAPACPSGGSWNAAAQQCEADAVQTCPDGYTLSGNECVKSSYNVGTTDMSSLTDFGITQTNTQDNITEEFGFAVPYPGLTPVKKGFIRKPSDFPSDMKQGYESDRKSDWLPFSVGNLNYFFVDTGISAQQCPSGQQATDDGCFENFAQLCPDGQVELYPDYKGKCYAFIENAACWDGQLQIGSECFKELSNTPDVCPSDGRSYTLLTPETADYICRTTTRPSCPSGDIRDGSTCYRTGTPTCPSGYTRQGGTCVQTQPADCPNGTKNIGGTCYYTANPQCPSGYVLTGNRQCSKDEWISGEVDDCYDASWNIIQFGQPLQCPDGYSKVTGLGRWYPVNGQAVGTCSSVSGTQNTAVGTHYAVCHAAASASCPSGYSFSSSYQVTSTFTETGHSHDYYNKDGSLILFGQYRWDYNESSPSCGSLYNHTYNCYSDASVYGGFVDSTVENESAGRICFNTSNRDCTAVSDGCVQYEGPACPDGYTWNGQACQKTISACPDGSYDADNDKCITYDRQACDISPYDWTYDPDNDICVHTAPAQCDPGQREKADNATWSACYQLDTSHGQPPGHIYCRDNLTYWNYGGREGCYQYKGTACGGQYQDEPPDVILGSGNRYGEWTGQCWKKSSDICPESDEIEGRGLFTTEYHCLKKNYQFDYITDNQTTPQEFGNYACNYVVDQMFAGQPDHVQCQYVEGQIDPKLGGGHDAWYDIYDPDTKVTKDYWPVCPINPNSVCVWAGGELELCGTDKKCAYCTKNVNRSVDYADVKKIAYYNDKFFGLTYNTHTFEEAQQMAADMSGTLPSSSQRDEVNSAFKMSVDCWYSDTGASSSVLYKPVVVIWNSLSDVGFFAPCDFDSNGDMICTADLTECVNGQCPYGDQYPCQPYQGKEYCSRFSSQCYNMGNPANTMETLEDTPEGVNDKKNDGNVTENGCEGNVYIFNGKDMRCRLPGIKTGFANCCKKHKDWFGLGKCKPGEVMLQQKVAAGLCHEVGTYCAVKLLGICIQKKKTYCCFHSVLGRIVQEQGREKQGLPYRGWGGAKDPVCWGFRPAQFQALDWSQIDLSEYYSYIEKKIVPQATQAAGAAVKKASQKLKNSFQHMFSQ